MSMRSEYHIRYQICNDIEKDSDATKIPADYLCGNMNATDI